MPCHPPQHVLDLFFSGAHVRKDGLPLMGGDFLRVLRLSAVKVPHYVDELGRIALKKLVEDKRPSPGEAVASSISGLGPPGFEIE